MTEYGLLRGLGIPRVAEGKARRRKESKRTHTRTHAHLRTRTLHTPGTTAMHAHHLPPLSCEPGNRDGDGPRAQQNFGKVAGSVSKLEWEWEWEWDWDGKSEKYFGRENC